MSPQEKRRHRDLERKHREHLDQLMMKHRAELMDATAHSFTRGQSQGHREGHEKGMAQVKEESGRARAAGIKEGMALLHGNVLLHAGRLYTERKDNDAAAVREVHRLLGLELAGAGTAKPA
jgi:hypothetical protein